MISAATERVGEAADQLVDKSLPSEVEVGVVGLKRRKPLVRAHVVVARQRVAAVTRRRTQRWVLDEDCALELLKLDTRFQTELLVEQRPRSAVHVEALRLPPRSIEREHQLCAEAFAIRMRADERFELGDQRRLPPELELGVDALLNGRNA